MITLRDVRLYSLRFPLWRPFRFGIVELKELEHLAVAANFLIEGQAVVGFAGENLVPRWFVKDRSQSIDAEITTMQRTVRTVADAATRLGMASTPFDLWWKLHQSVRERSLAAPALLAQLAESLVERAAIDAWCRFHHATFSELLHTDRLGVEFGDVHDCLRAAPESIRLFEKPPTHLLVRHTVGLTDEVSSLPAELRENGIHRLKIKLAGDAYSDARRIRDVLRACETDGWPIDRLTLDGNENYNALAEFGEFASLLELDADLKLASKKVAWIEQPFHRDIALSDEIGPLIARLNVPMIIDESDSSPHDLPRALALGYAGTTHKNCKGVFNSILHRALLNRHSAVTGKTTILSGEDLTIVAPWSQASDLMIAAAVGVDDVERNGHHFADGLSGFGSEVSDEALLGYPQLYRRREDGVVQLRIVEGRVEIPSQDPGPPNLDHFIEVTP